MMSETHKVIIVMGPIGSGKTQFVNRTAGTSFTVGDSLEGNHTMEVQSATISIDSQLVEVVDTPGLDSTHESETKEAITQHLRKLSRQNRIVGFIYMYRISDRRMTESSRKAFQSFTSIITSICDTNALSRVSIVTNMWGLVSNGDGERREKELRDADYCFKDAINRGARLVRNDVNGSGMRILRQMLDNPPVTPQEPNDGDPYARKCFAGLKPKFWRRCTAVIFVLLDILKSSGMFRRASSRSRNVK